MILDVYTKWPDVFWVKSTSFEAIKKHMDTWFAEHGFAEYVKSDNGPPFNSRAFADYLEQHGIKHSRIIPENPSANEVENFMRNLRKALDVAKLKKEDYKTYIRRMLMVIRATPTKTTGVSPYYAATGRHMDPGIIDKEFPRGQSAGLSRKESELIRQNIVAQKMRTNERLNKQPGRVHLPLTAGDTVLVRLGTSKTREKDHFTVTSVRGNEITARNNNSGTVLKRHLSRFTKVMEKSTQPPTEYKQEPLEDRKNDPLPIPIISDDTPLQPQNEPEAQQQQQQRDQRAQQQPGRNVQFNPRAHTGEYNQNDQISPPTTRRSATASGVPVPTFENTPTTLEYNRRNQETARQLINQYRIARDEATQRNNPLNPPRD